MSEALEIVQLGNPILWMTADPVNDPTDQETRDLADSLIATMLESDAWGLAAPQLGQSRRLIVFRCYPTPRHPDAPVIEPKLMVNPRLISATLDAVAGWESCRSVPGLWGMVERPKGVHVEFTDVTGARREETYIGVLARIVQHETDHRDGVLYLDRVKSTRDLYAHTEMLKRCDG